MHKIVARWHMRSIARTVHNLVFLSFRVISLCSPFWRFFWYLHVMEKLSTVSGSTREECSMTRCCLPCPKNLMSDRMKACGRPSIFRWIFLWVILSFVCRNSERRKPKWSASSAQSAKLACREPVLCGYTEFSIQRSMEFVTCSQRLGMDSHCLC